MRKIENECCDCAVPGYPCRGAACPNITVLHVYCDGPDCDCEDEEMYVYNGKDYCRDCLLKELIADGIIEQVDFDE